MTHTGEDYSELGPSTTTFTLDDLAELAARLGSIVTHDRRGNVVWMTDFEGVDINEFTVTKSGLADAYLATTTHLRGTQSLKIVTGEGSIDDLTLKKPIALPVIGRMGMEMAIAHPTGGFQFFMSMDLYDGTTLHQPRVMYAVADEKWYYLNSGGTYTAITGTGAIGTTTALFNIVKLVADYDTGKYIRCIINNTEYDLSTISYYSSANTTSAHMSLEFFYNASTSASSINVYIDNIIFTQNEP